MGGETATRSVTIYTTLPARHPRAHPTPGVTSLTSSTLMVRRAASPYPASTSARTSRLPLEGTAPLLTGETWTGHPRGSPLSMSTTPLYTHRFRYRLLRTWVPSSSEPRRDFPCRLPRSPTCLKARGATLLCHPLLDGTPTPFLLKSPCSRPTLQHGRPTIVTGLGLPPSAPF